MKQETEMKKSAIGKRMKIAVVIVFTIVPFLNMEAQEAAQEVHLRRSSLVVGDLEKSLSLYRDILGFEVGPVGTYEKDNYAYQVFNIPEEATIRVATLNSTDQQRIINLKEVTGITLSEYRSALFTNVLLIKVADLKTVMQKISALGLQTTEEHTVKGSRLSYIEQSFTDFDGHRIALYQLL